MKARDVKRILAAVKNARVDKRGAALGEAELVQLIRREIRTREEAEDYASKAGRQELVEQNRAERAMLEAFVPAQLDPEQLEHVIREVAAAPEARTLGAIMGALRERLAGRYDGRLASEIARRVLASAATP